MITEKMVATALMTIALMLPGVFSGLEFGAMLAKVLGGIGLMVFFVEILRAFVNHKFPSLRGASKVSFMAALLLFFLYAIASVDALLAGNALVSDNARITILVNLLVAGPAMSGVWVLYRRDPLNLLRNTAICLCAALTVLLATNLLMVSLGIRHKAYADTPQVQVPALLLSWGGVQINRVLLPISSGVNNGAILPSAGLLMSILFLGRASHKMWAYFCLAPISLILLLMNDTRSFMIATVVALLMSLILFKKTRALPLVVVFLPVLPPVVTLFSAVASPFLNALVSARYDTFGMFSGREFIWGMAFNQWLTSVAPISKLFGSGLYGQVSAGLSTFYDELFANFSDTASELASLHNSYLQVVADVGLFGLSVLVLLLAVLTHRLSKLVCERGTNGIAASGLLAVLVTITMAGGTEVSISPYSRESVSLLAMLISVSVLALTSSVKVKVSRDNNLYAR